MSAPAHVRVKLSSEAAGSISLTPVVVRDLEFAALIDELSAVCGKDCTRALQILRRGSFVSGATRFRWEPLALEPADLAGCLAQLPDPDPARIFAGDQCTRLLLIGSPGAPIPVDRRLAAQRRFLRRRSFWGAIVEAAPAPEYVTYDYRERADRYRASVHASGRARIQAALSLLRNAALARQIARLRCDCVEFLTPR
jgi:hypothetical protein